MDEETRKSLNEGIERMKADPEFKRKVDNLVNAVTPDELLDMVTVYRIGLATLRSSGKNDRLKAEQCEKLLDEKLRPILAKHVTPWVMD